MIRRPELRFDRDFTILPNLWVRDPRTSFATKGLLAQLLSHTPGWEVSITRLADKNGVGKDAIRACIRQAVECGYLRVSRSRDAKGMLREAIYELMDPFERNPQSEPKSGFPTLADPTLVNPTPKKNIHSEDQEEELPHRFAAGSALDELENSDGPLTSGEELLVENMLDRGQPLPKIKNTLRKQRTR